MEPPGGLQDMSSEVAKIAGDAVEAAAQVRCGAAQVALMAINGDFTVISWDFYGSLMGFHGLFMIFNGISWTFHDFQWDFMEFSWDFNEFLMGFLMECNGIMIYLMRLYPPDISHGNGKLQWFNRWINVIHLLSWIVSCFLDCHKLPKPVFNHLFGANHLFY